MALRTESVYRISDDDSNFEEVTVTALSEYIQIEQDGSIIEFSRSMGRDVLTALEKILPQSSGYFGR